MLVVQKTGWGKSAVYFVATALLRGLGAGPTVIISPLLALMRNQIEAAERAGIRAATINSTNIEDWSGHPRAGRRGRDRRAAGQPRAAEQPDVPRRGAPPADRDRRAARHRRGALHLRLGPRLPARLPPHPADDHHAPARHPGARHDGDGQRPGDRRRRRAAGHRRAGAARLARPGVAAPRGAPARAARAAAGLAGRAPRRARRLRDHLHAHRRRDPGGRRAPAVARPRRRGVLRADRGHRAARARAGPARRAAQGAGRDQRARDGLRRAARLRGQPRGALVTGRLLPAGRPRRPRHRPRPGDAAAGARGPRHLALLRLAGLPARAARPHHPARAGRERRADVDGRAGDLRRPEPHPPRDDAQGARRRRRGRPGARRLDRHRAGLGLRPGALRPGGGGAARRAGGDARLHRHRRLPDAVPARAARRPRGADDCGRCDNCGGPAAARSRSPEPPSSEAE